MQENIILDTLKEKYFDLCREEQIGKDSTLTAKIDRLEAEIRKEQKRQAKMEAPCAS